MVWVHVVIATLLWLAVLWSVATAGQLTPGSKYALRRTPEPAPSAG
jgi:hypothetical protein